MNVPSTSNMMQALPTYNPQHIINNMYIIIWNTGLYHDACDKWDDREDNEKMRNEFKLFFMKEYKNSVITLHAKASAMVQIPCSKTKNKQIEQQIQLRRSLTRRQPIVQQ